MNSKSVKEGGIKSMYSKSKRFIASFLAVLMAVCMLPVEMFGVAGVVFAATPLTTDNTTVTATGAAGTEPAVTVVYIDGADNTELTKDTDYTVSYEKDGSAITDFSGVAAGDTVTVKITGTGAYEGDVTTTYTVTGGGNDKTTLAASMIKIGDAGVGEGNVAEYTAKYVDTAITLPAVTVDGYDETTDYTYAFKDAEGNEVSSFEAAGDYTVTVSPVSTSSKLEGTDVVITIKITADVPDAKVDLADKTITVGGAAVVVDKAAKTGTTTYTIAATGSKIEPAVEVDGCTAADDYDLSYGENTAAGDGTVTITPKAESTKLKGDAITVTFTITEGNNPPVTGTVHKLDSTNLNAVSDMSTATKSADDDYFTFIASSSKAVKVKKGIATVTNGDSNAIQIGLTGGGLSTGYKDIDNNDICGIGVAFTSSTKQTKVTVKFSPKVDGGYVIAAKGNSKLSSLDYTDIKGSNGAVVAKESTTAYGDVYTETFTLSEGNDTRYVIGFSSSGGVILSIEVTEIPDGAASEDKDLSTATVTLTKNSEAYTGEAITPAITVTLDGEDVTAKCKVTYARKTGDSDPAETDYKESAAADLTSVGTVYVKATANAAGYKGETAPVQFEITKGAAPTVTPKSVAADVSKATADQISADSMPQEIKLADLFKFDSKYGTATFKNANVNDASGAENNILAADPGLTIDGTTLKFNTKATLPTDAVKKATITVEAEFENYETAALTIEVTLSSKTELTIEGITVADKTYDGDAVEPAADSLVIKNGETEVTDADLKQSLVYTYAVKDGDVLEEAPKDAGEYTLTVSVPLDNESYSGSSAEISFKISQAALTVTAKNREWTIGYSAPAASAPAGKEAEWYEVTGLVKNETLEALEATVGFTYKIGESAVTDWTTVTETDEVVIVPALDGLVNYTVTPVNAKLTVKKEAALKENEHELNLTKDWYLDETSKTLKHNGDDANTDGYFKVEGPAKVADANNSYPLVAYGSYENAIKMNADGKVTFTAPKDSTLEIIVHTQEATSGLKVDSTSLISGSTGKSNATVVKLGDGTLVEPYNHTGAPTDLSVYKVTITLSAGGEHTITRDGKECQLYYVKVTEPSGGNDTVAINATINGAPEGAKVYFVPATGEPVEASASSSLISGTDYSLVLKDASGNEISGYTVTIEGSSTYRPTAAGNVTINVVPVVTDKVAFTQLPAFTINDGADLATPHPGDVLTLTFAANDKADTTKTEIKWYTKKGTEDAKELTGVSADKLSYTIKTDDVDATITAEVTLKASEGSEDVTKTAANAGKVVLVKAEAPAAYGEDGTTPLPEGEVETGTKLVLKSTETGAKIYYTTDGNTPEKKDENLYSSPIVIDKDMTVKAFAAVEGKADSDVKSFAYTAVAAGTVLAPYATPEAGTYSASQSVTLTSRTAGAKVYYTIDGNDPVYPVAEDDTSTKEFTAAITVDKSMTIKAIAVKAEMTNSSVAKFEYKITSSAPVATGYTENKAVAADTEVELTCATADAAIYFALGDSVSSAKAALSNKPQTYSADNKPKIQVGKTVIAAYAKAEGGEASEIVTFVYKISLSAPTATPAAGEVTKGTYVKLTSKEGAAIYYKTGSSAADITAAKEKLYTNGIRIDSDTYIWAVAKKDDAESAPFTGNYTIKKDALGNPVVNSDGLEVELADPSEVLEYTGKAVTPAVIVTNNSEPLIEGVDYTVKYSNNIKANTGADGSLLARAKLSKVTVTGKGNLSGSAYTEFKIYQKDLGDEDIFAPDVTVLNNKTAALVLAYNGVKLSAKDYKVTAPATGAKTKWTESGSMTLDGQGNFKGTTDINVTVVDRLQKIKVVVDTKSDKAKAILAYNGEEKKEKLAELVTVYAATDKKNETPLSEFESYMISWPANTTDAGAVKFTVLGCGEYTGLIAKSFTIKPATDKNNSTAITITGGPWGADGSGDSAFAKDFVSTGVTFNDELSVSDNAGNDLVEGKDYKVAYSGNKKFSEGKAKVTVSFIGNYKGNKAQFKTFTINKLGSAAVNDIDVKFGSTKPWTKAGIYKAPVYLSIDGAALSNSDFDIKYYTDATRTTEMKGKNTVSLAKAANGTDDEDYAEVFVTITGKGKGNFTNEAVINTSYNVYATNATRTIDLSKAKVKIYDGDAAKPVSKLPYSGNEIELEKCDSTVTRVKGTYYVEVLNGTTQVDKTQYKVEYSNNKNKGKATVIITPIETEGATTAGSKTATFTIAANNLKALQDLLFKNSKEPSQQ